MKSRLRNRLPSWHQQLTASFVAVLVLALGVFAASPVLHAWLHDHGGVPVKTSAAPAGHGGEQPGHDDDGCGVTMFANGVVLTALGLFVISALGRLIDSIRWMETAGYRQTLRYWLPPLCGPPLS